jgi:hypothetical protein
LVALAVVWPAASASALDVSRTEDRILEPAAHARITYENTVNVASYQQDGILTHNGYQYTAWYVNDGSGAAQASAVIARRALPGGAWESARLNHPLWSNDSHNTIALGVTPSDGRLHVTFPTHDNPVRYTRTVPGVLDDPEDFEWSSLLFDRIHILFPGAAGAPQTFTYPQFENVQGQTLLTWRDGSTNNGRQAVLRYNDDPEGTWTFLGRFTHNAGGSYNGGFGSSATRYGYIHGFTADPSSGDLAVTLSWRELNSAWCTGPLAVGNHDLGYTVSSDAGLTWRNNADDPVATTTLGGTGETITPFTPGIVVEPIGINKGLINQETQSFDSAGRLHVVTSRVPDEDITGDCVGDFYAERAANATPYHHWRDAAGAWHTMQLPFRSGSSGRSKIAFDAADNAYVVLPDARIIAATAASGWTDWEVVFDDPAVENVSELIIDRQRVREADVLTVAYQEPPSDVGVCAGGSASPLCTSAYRLASFDLDSTAPDAPRATEPEAAPHAFEGFADDAVNLALNRAGSGEPAAFATNSQGSFPPALANDGNVETFWVSAGTASGQGPSQANPINLGVDLGESHPLGEVTMVPRVNFGPRAYTVEVSGNGTDWTEVAAVRYAANGEVTTTFPTTDARYLRLRITDSWDSVQPPRNVQVAELIVRARDDSADTVAPQVEAELAGTQNDGGAYVNLARLDLNAVDEGYGVHAIEFRVNGGDWQEYGGPLRFTEAGAFAVDYRASDLSGNASEPGAISFTVAANGTCMPTRSDEFEGGSLDTDRWSFRHPTTPGSGAGAPSVAGGELVLPLGGYSLDLTRPGPVALLGQPLPEGDFALQAKISAPGLNTSNGGLGSAFAQVGFKLYQGNDNWIKLTHSRNADGGGMATTYFEMSHESTSANRTLGPRIGLAQAATNLPTWWMRITRTDSTINGYYSLTDPEGLGGAAWVDMGLAPNVDTVMPPGNGPRHIAAYGGNGNSTATFDYIRFEPDELVGCDLESPSTTATLDPAEPGPGEIYTEPVEVSLNADDGEEGSGVAHTEYRLNGGGWLEYAEPFTLSAPLDYEIEYRSVDLAGNAEEPNSIAFAIAGAAALELAVKPKSKRVKVGKRATFTATATNTGDADASEVEVCAKAPAKKAKIVGKACASATTLEPEGSFAPKFTLKPKRSARGKRVKVTFKATSPDAETAKATAVLKVKGR